MFCYRAECVFVHDGDTLTVLVDLGFGTFRKERLRLLGLNCPERGTPQGIAATEYTQAWFASGKSCQIQTVKDRREKYGRYLARVVSLDGRCLNDDLLKHEMALPYT